MEISKLYTYYLQNPIICTDTRSIKPGCLFFALKGDNFNGNKFALQAIELGAALAIIDEDISDQNSRLFKVDDVLIALQELAKYHRQQILIPIIGITGSNGKTTCKELIKAVLSTHFKTFATIGNLNNHIGVPLSVLSILPDTEVAIIEMGANHQQEIAFLCKICQPKIGLITNVGKAHLEGFGGFEGVKKGKKELYDFLGLTNGITFINRPDDNLERMSSEISTKFYYGTNDDNYICGNSFLNNNFVGVNWWVGGEPEQKFEIQSNLTGLYNFDNIMAAIAIGYYFTLTPNLIKQGIENYIPENNRSQLAISGNLTIIKDYYNANPSSMRAAIKNLKTMPAEYKIAILGDMFELGDESETEHQSIILLAIDSEFDQLIFVGERFYEFKRFQNFSINFFEKTEDLAKKLNNLIPKKASILIKGSRGIKLEKIAELL